MPTTYKGTTIPLATDLADGPKAFQDYTDSLAVSDALKAMETPAGTVVFTCRTTAPVGWLLLDGSTVSGAQTLYPNLWAVVPAAWRSGANLVLPDARGRLVIGLNPADTSIDAIGELVGARTKALVEANLPPHAHAQQGTFRSGGATARHNHGAIGGAQYVLTSAGSSLAANTGAGRAGAGLTDQDTPDHAHDTTISGNTGNGAGASTPVDITPPSLVLNILMRAS